MRMLKKNTFVRQLWTLIDPVVQAEGYELVDLDFVRGKKASQVRIFVDRPEGGIGVDECSRLSGVLGNLLDVEDSVKGSYQLEVSSPGIDRPLVKQRDFERAAGRTVKLKCDLPVEGRRNFTGTLLEVDDKGTLVVDCGEDTTVSIPWDCIARANLVVSTEEIFGHGSASKAEDRNRSAKR